MILRGGGALFFPLCIAIVLDWLALSSRGNTKQLSHVWKASQARTMAIQIGYAVFRFGV